MIVPKRGQVVKFCNIAPTFGNSAAIRRLGEGVDVNSNPVIPAFAGMTGWHVAH